MIRRCIWSTILFLICKFCRYKLVHTFTSLPGAQRMSQNQLEGTHTNTRRTYRLYVESILSGIMFQALDMCDSFRNKFKFIWIIATVFGDSDNAKRWQNEIPKKNNRHQNKIQNTCINLNDFELVEQTYSPHPIPNQTSVLDRGSSIVQNNWYLLIED